MPVEIEKRFKNFNYKKTKKIIQDNGFTFFGSFLFKVIYYKTNVPNQTIRLRDEGHRITFTIKMYDPNKYELEDEIIINDFNVFNKMLNSMGVEKGLELHKYREIYMSNDQKTEIIFDHFPGLPPYMEIESETEKNLFDTMRLLDLNEDSKFNSLDLYLEHYNINKNQMNDCPLNFYDIEPCVLKLIENKNNKKKFSKLLKKQKKSLILIKNF